MMPSVPYGEDHEAQHKCCGDQRRDLSSETTESAPRLGPTVRSLDDGSDRPQGTGAQENGQISLADWTVKLPEIWPVPPRIGSRICGAEMDLLVEDDRKQAADILAASPCPKRCAPWLSKREGGQRVSLVRESKVGLGVDEVLHPETMERFSIR